MNTQSYNNSSSFGVKGERVALRYLRSKGYFLLEKNFCNPKGRRIGEIDLIMKSQKTIVFVEVKTRLLQKSPITFPESSITRTKLYKINKIAQYYIRINNLWEYDYRFDAVSVWLTADCLHARVRHLPYIFY